MIANGRPNIPPIKPIIPAKRTEPHSSSERFIDWPIRRKATAPTISNKEMPIEIGPKIMATDLIVIILWIIFPTNENIKKIKRRVM